MKRICLFMVLFVFTGATVWGDGYNYVEAEDLMQKIQKNEQLVLLDIQVEEEYQKHHIEGAVATYAYPVRSEGDKNKLDEALTQIAEKEGPVVIVCPRGGGGAKRTYDYLKVKGVAEERLTILAGGQEDWPY